MKSIIQITKKYLPLAAILLLAVALTLSGCAPTQATETAGDHEDDHNHDHESEASTDHADRVPNGGAVVRIISPEDGITFSKGEDVVVEIEVENFELSAEGYHWHVYVDGNVWAQVVGGGTKEVLRGLEAGEHRIEVYLGLPTHEELEEGAEIRITVAE